MEQVPAIDLAGILDASDENKWVAITPDYRRVLAADASLSELMRQFTDPGVIFHRVLPRDVGFAPQAAR
jgi:hypothetical protein